MGHKQLHDSLDKHIADRMDSAKWNLDQARRAEARGDSTAAAESRARADHWIDEATEARNNHKKLWGC